MKFVVSWTVRDGLSEDQLARGLKLGDRSLQVEGLEYREFLGRIDGNGGFAVVETEDASALLRATSLYTPYTNCVAYAVLEMDQFAEVANRSVGVRGELYKGTHI